MRHSLSFGMGSVICFLFTASVANSQVTQVELRQFTEDAVQNGTVAFAKPTILWEPDHAGLILGGLLETHMNRQDQQPIEVPLRCQYIITGLRLYRTAPQQRQFWIPVLTRAEAKVSEMLQLVQSDSMSGKTLSRALSVKEHECLDILESEFEKLARSHGKQLAAPAPWNIFTVEITTVPEGGQVSFIDSGRWELWNFLASQGIQHPKPQWTAIKQTPARLGGMYWFKVEWPNRPPRILRTEVTQSGQLEL